MKHLITQNGSRRIIRNHLTHLHVLNVEESFKYMIGELTDLLLGVIVNAQTKNVDLDGTRIFKLLDGMKRNEGICNNLNHRM